MIFLLLDLFINSYTKYSLFTHIFILNTLPIKKIIPFLMLIYIFSFDYFYLILLLAFYIIINVIKKFVNVNLLISLMLFIILLLLYYHLNIIDLIINITFVILIYYCKYNKSGDVYKKDI